MFDNEVKYQNGSTNIGYDLSHNPISYYLQRTITLLNLDKIKTELEIENLGGKKYTNYMML